MGLLWPMSENNPDAALMHAAPPRQQALLKMRALRAAMTTTGEQSNLQLCDEVIDYLSMASEPVAQAAAEKIRLDKISHDLRSPLNAILGFAQVMELDPAPKTAMQTDAIAQILRSGWQLLGMINAIQNPPLD